MPPAAAQAEGKQGPGIGKKIGGPAKPARAPAATASSKPAASKITSKDKDISLKDRDRKGPSTPPAAAQISAEEPGEPMPPKDWSEALDLPEPTEQEVARSSASTSHASQQRGNRESPAGAAG